MRRGGIPAVGPSTIAVVPGLVLSSLTWRRAENSAVLERVGEHVHRADVGVGQQPHQRLDTKRVHRDDAAEGATAAGQRISLYGYRQVRSKPEIGQWQEFE
jgi:hypothetical protein